MKPSNPLFIGEEERMLNASGQVLNCIVNMSRVFRGENPRDALAPIPVKEFRNDVVDLIRRFPNTRFTKGVFALNIHELPPPPGALFFCLCELFLTHPFTPVNSSDFSSFPSENAFIDGIDTLLEQGLAVSVTVNSSEESKVRKDQFLLSPKACNAVFHGKEDLIRQVTVAQFGSIITWKDIREKRLFFPASLQEQLELISRVVSHDGFPKVRKGLADRGLRNGITVLLSGPPGTGKTEFVRQLARHEGRNIFQVDAARMDGTYYGEKPRNLRDLFLLLRYMSAIMESIPITFIDEADALLGRRVELQRAADKEENLTANTILEELNTFDGILFAATNNANLLDPAMDRRFLLKAFFPVPDAHVLAGIWRSKLPFLTQEDALTLANRYSLSGALVDNIVSLCVLQEIVDGKKPTLEQVIRHCEGQAGGADRHRRKIGFCEQKK
jgi:hypothetical protein